MWRNPKGWATALSAAASFAALASGPFQLGAPLGFAFGAAAILSLSLWCVAGLLLARLLRIDTQWLVVDATPGLLLASSIAPRWLQ
jgi:threonine/homoserine/homoserine lactone efflux protein